MLSPRMSDPSGLSGLLDVDRGVRGSEARSAFPQSVGALVDRLGSLYGSHHGLERVPRVVEPWGAVPLEASVSLRRGPQTEVRLTLGFPPRPGDPQARAALVAALSGLGAERISATVDESLASVAPTAGRRLVRGLALRARRDEPARPRTAAWVGGGTASERSARIAHAMLGLGLDHAAALHERIAAGLAANPFCAVVAYGLGFDLGQDRVLGAKTYFVCEWADAAIGLLGGPLADVLRLDSARSFELLAASARPDVLRSRWPLEVSFELPADLSRGIRTKVYLPPPSVDSSEAEAHAGVVRLADQLGLDPLPYEELVATLRPDGLSPERPSSLMVGLSASARGPSLEVYLFDPARWAVPANQPARV